MYSLRWSSLRVGVGFLFQVLGLAVELTHAVDGFVDAFDQALALIVGEAEFAYAFRDVHHSAG